MANKKEVPAGVPAVGSMAPEFGLQADDGSTVRLRDLRGKRVVLYFYPKDMTTGCTEQACSFRDVYPQVKEANAVVLGVSPDDVDSHVKFKQKHGLNFPLLADEGHKVADAYGVWGEKNNYGKTYMGIIRSHFVIDEEGRIADVQYGVSPSASVESAMTALHL